MNAIRRWWLGATFVAKLSQFISECFRYGERTGLGPRGNAWIVLRWAKVHVRFGPIFMDDHRRLKGVTLASVEVVPGFYRRGFFKVIMTILETNADVNKFGAVTVENVHNEHLYAYLVRRGYRPFKLFPLNLYKETYHS